MKIEKFSHIAGVTFANDDGTSRQQLLAGIFKTGKPVLVTLYKTKFHNEETGEDEDAIQVIHKAKILGWIPRTDIDKCSPYNQMVMVTNFYKNIYSGALCVPEPPTAKQYGAIQARKKQGKLESLPEYDRLCYSYALSH